MYNQGTLKNTVLSLWLRAGKSAGMGASAISLLIAGCSNQVGFLWLPCLHSFYLVYVFPISFVIQKLWIIPSGGITLYVVLYSVYPWGEVSSAYSWTPLQDFFFFIVFSSLWYMLSRKIIIDLYICNYVSLWEFLTLIVCVILIVCCRVGWFF